MGLGNPLNRILPDCIIQDCDFVFGRRPKNQICIMFVAEAVLGQM